MKKNTTILAVLMLGLSACMPLSSGRSGVGQKAFVTNEKDNNLMVVDLGNREVVQTIPTGKTPHALVFTPAGKGYVNNRGEGSLTVIDAATGKIAAVIAVHATIHHFATAPDGTIYVCHGKLEDGSLGVSVLDPNSDRVIKTITIPMAPGEKAKGHHGAFSPDGRFFYFANEGGRTLAIIDTASLSVIKNLQVGQGAGHTYFSPDGKRAFVVCHHDNVVAVIDTASQTVIRKVLIGEGKKQGHSGYFGPDGDFYMLNAADGMLCRIDAASLRLTAQVKMGAKPMIMVVR